MLSSIKTHNVLSEDVSVSRDIPASAAYLNHNITVKTTAMDLYK